MAVIPLGDVSRRPTRVPLVTATIIAVNTIGFVIELARGEEFVTRWSVVPAEIVARHHWITILTAMFMHASWSHIIGNMVFLWAFGPEVEDLMDRWRYLAFYVLGGLAATLAQVRLIRRLRFPTLVRVVRLPPSWVRFWSRTLVTGFGHSS
jgi:membrane associated rhomboid family serine protease